MQRESSSDSAEQWLNIAKSLIEKGANVNATDNWKQTPLHLVDNLEIADLFIKHSANVNAPDNNGRTPLHTVSNTEVAQLLVNSGADMQVKDVQGKMPIFQHLEKSHAEIVRILIDKGADVNSKNEIIRHMKSTEPADKDQNEMRKIIQDCAPTTVDSLKRAIKSMSLETVRLVVKNKDLKPETPSRCLCIAAKHGEIKIVDYFVKSGADINSQYEDKNALEWAISGGYMKIVEILVNAGVEVNAKGRYGRTPLFQCALKSQAEMMKFLIGKGANVNATDEDDYTPICYAKDREIAEILIGSGAEINAAGKYRRTPLLQCVLKSQAEMVKFLVDKGISVNSRDRYRNTPLHYARNVEIAEILINAGADINTMGRHKRTPLFQSVLKSRTEVVQFLLSKGTDATIMDEYLGTALHYTRNIEIAENLITHGADINSKDKNGRTLLFRCVLELRTEMVQFLVEKGADVNLKDEEGNTPLHYTKNREIAKVLADAGADIDAAGKHRRTPLFQCALKSQAETMKFLISKSANVNARDEDNYTPIYYVKDREIAEILIDHGADINVVGRYQITPLFQYVLESQTEMVQFLVGKGADVNSRDEYCNAPLHYTESREIAEILVNARADINAVGEYEKTPLFACVERSLIEIIRFLIDKGAEVNARDEDNYTPIYYVTDREVAEILIGSGADVNIIRKYRRTLLFQYILEKQIEMVQFLVDKGISVNSRDEYCNTPLHYARNREIAEILINAGAKINAMGRHKRTPLFQSVLESRTEVVQFLLGKGADATIMDEYLGTALHYTRNIKITENLIAYGADINSKDKNGRTLLFRCVLESRAEMIQLLIKKGADVNSMDNNGYIPIQYAETKEIAEIFINAGAYVNVKSFFRRIPQAHYTFELRKLLPQFLRSKEADKATKDIALSARIDHIESAEIAGGNSGHSTNVNVKHKPTMSMEEILSLVSDVSAVVSNILEKYKQVQRCKTQCRALAENVMGIHELVKKFYATSEKRRDKAEDLEKSLKRFLIIIRDAQDIINKHCNVGFFGKIFLRNNFEDDFKNINQRLTETKEAFNIIMEVKIPDEITKLIIDVSDMSTTIEEADEDIKNAVKEAKEGVKKAIESVQKAKDSEVIEIPTIKDSEIKLDEPLGPIGRALGTLKWFIPVEINYDKDIAKDKRKLETMWKLSSCEGILTLHGLYQYKDKLCMVTERMNPDCPSLSLMIKRKTFFRDWGVIRSMSLELANAIGFMHECGILHKGICSNNIYIAGDRNVRIYDFEYDVYIIEDVYARLPQGMPRWMAPERLQKTKPDYDEKCDIYSLGAVMWSLATHEVPFDKLALREIPDAKLEIPENIPKEFAVIIEGCIDRDREKRWSMKMIIDNLLKLVPENLEK